MASATMSRLARVRITVEAKDAAISPALAM